MALHIWDNFLTVEHAMEVPLHLIHLKIQPAQQRMIFCEKDGLQRARDPLNDIAKNIRNHNIKLNQY